MKRNLLSSILAISSVTFLSAQVVLTSATHGINIGDINTTFYADTNISPGSSGTGQIWNFSNLYNGTTSYSTTYIDPASTPYSAVFPTSNLAYMTGGAYVYYSASSGSLSYDGYLSSDGDTTLFTNSEIVANYPFAYSNTYTDSFYSAFNDNSQPFVCHGTTTVTADGSGTLILPSGSYPVLRLKWEQHYTDSGNGHNYLLDDMYYQWYSATDKFPLLTIYIYNNLDMTTSTTSYYKYVSISSVVAGMNEQKISPLSINLFPNPATENAKLNFTVTENQQIDIFVSDLEGKIILEINRGELSAGEYAETINLAALSKGIYFVKVQGGKNSETEKLIVE